MPSKLDMAPGSAFVAQVVSALYFSDARTATKYVTPTRTIKATRRHRPDRRQSRIEVVVTWGSPNYIERAAIKALRKAGESFPVKRVALRSYPKTKG